MVWYDDSRVAKVLFLVIVFVVIPYVSIGALIYYNLPLDQGDVRTTLIFFSICAVLTTLVSCICGFHCAKRMAETEDIEKGHLITAPLTKFTIDTQYPQNL